MKMLIFLFFLFISFLLSAETVYYCPMHPTYTSKSKGNCPICGMNLVLREDKKNKFEDTTKIIEIDNKDMRPFIKTMKIYKKDFVINLSFPGIVAYDVDLYKIIDEYRIIKELETKNKQNTSFAEAIFIRANRYGIGKKELDYFILSGYNGLVLLDRKMYVYGYLNQRDIKLVEIDMEVKLSFNETELVGRVIAIGGFVDENKRVRVIIEFENHNLSIKQGMYCNIKLNKKLGKKLLIPEGSYIEYGERDIIYVKNGNTYQPRFIKTGISNGDYVEIINGLSEYEEIVVSPNFMIDSEARLKGILNEH